MNSNSKADLQRRLAAAPAPAPPAGLAEKIKKDIPLPAPHRAGGRPRLVGMGIAASLVLVAGSAYVTMRMWRPDNLKTAPVTVQRARETVSLPEPTVRAAAADSAGAASVPPPPASALEPSPFGNTAYAPPASPEADSANGGAARRDSRLEERRQAAPVAQRDEAAAGIDFVAAAEAGPPPPMAAPPPPAAAEAVAARREEAAERTTMAAAAPAAPAGRAAAGGAAGSWKTAHAAPEYAPQIVRSRTLFGVPSGEEAFARVKQAIENGQRPADVSVEGLINYFAGPRRVNRSVALEVEASPGATPASTLFVRVSIDTRAAAGDLGVADRARLTVDFEPGAVLSQRRVGGPIPAAAELLRTNTSVTMIYEVKLADALSRRARLATVRLRYDDAASGKPQEISATLHAIDIVPKWQLASPRHRRASLGAVWGETLRADSGAADVAVRAEELSSERPEDGRARDLARLATAFSRLRSSSPTGSGL